MSKKYTVEIRKPYRRGDWAWSVYLKSKKLGCGTKRTENDARSAAEKVIQDDLYIPRVIKYVVEK